MIMAEFLSWDLVSFLAGLCHTAEGRTRYEPRAILAAQGFLQCCTLRSEARRDV